MTHEAAPFDDVRAALRFALNASRAAPPTAYMNKAMAEVRVEIKRRKRAPGDATAQAQALPGAESAEQLLELEEAIKTQSSRSLIRVRPRAFRGLDAAHQAGLILHHFSTLPRDFQIVLMGRCTTPYQPCSCGRPCCCGRVPTNQWVSAVRDTCEILRDAGAVLPDAPGKKGLGTPPFLRELFVRRFYDHEAHTLQGLARAGGVTTVTAAKHRAWIYAYLEGLERDAWGAAAELFDRVGITGDQLWAAPAPDG